MKRVRVAELKNNLSRYLRAAEAGETIEVTDRARPLARLVPVDPVDPARRATIRPAPRSLAEVRARRIAPLKLGVDIATILDEERTDRVLPGSS